MGSDIHSGTVDIIYERLLILKLFNAIYWLMLDNKQTLYYRNKMITFLFSQCFSKLFF